MSKRRVYRLGDLQLRIMKMLWSGGPLSVAEIHESLGSEPPLAYTTVATMLRKMEGRGLVKHQVAGRRFIYRAAVPADAVHRGMADHVLDRVFEGSLADLVSHLLTTRAVSSDELDRLEQLIADRKRTP